MDTDNVLIKNLGKGLDTKVKYVAVARFYNEMKSKQSDEIFFCLGIKKVFILASDLNQSKMVFDYASIDSITLETSNKDVFYINFTKNTHLKVQYIKISSKFRAVLLKSIMCYYSIYFMNEESEIRDITLLESNSGINNTEPKNQSEPKKIEKKEDIKKFTIKNYEYLNILCLAFI